jgi:uncharacterized membrane protein required for colicin V production
MNKKALVPMIFFDIFILGLIMLAGFNGFRRGGIRSLLSLFWIYISFIATAFFYERMALFIQVTFENKSPMAMVISFCFIFAVVFAITRVINFLLTKLIKPVLVDSNISCIIGALLGVFEGILIIGIVFMVIAFYPVNPPLSNSFSFQIISQVAPMVRDVTLPNYQIDNKPVYEPRKMPNTLDGNLGSS